MNFVDYQNLNTEIPETVSLEEQYTKLTKQEKLMLFCKINGFSRIPPTIEQLYSDPYYLGGPDFFDGGTNLFQYWKDKLPEIYPNEVSVKKNYLILSGAIGIGKSTVSRLCLAMTYAKLLCMKSPSRTLHLTPKPFSAVIYHRDEKVAYKEFRNWFVYDVLEKSPFFKNTKPNFKFNVLTGGPLSNVGLGSDVLLYIISEVNFFPNQERAMGILKSAYGRFTSRFNSDALSMVGNLIVDSSATGDSSCSEWFLDHTPPEKTWNCHPAHYEVKPQDYKESGGKTFNVYTGDGKYPAQILPHDYTLADDQDPERVIQMPVQLMSECKLDLIKTLQDKAGISTTSSDLFFQGSIQRLVDCSQGRVNKIPEKIVVDFYDKTDRIYDKIKPALSHIPYGSTMWIGLDLAVIDDYTGISAVAFDKWEVIGKTKVPKIKTYFNIAVGRKEGQETSLFHIFDLIMTLSRDYQVVVSADIAFSKSLLQDCEREGIKTNGRISTDTVPCDPALYLKNQIMSGLIDVPPNKRLFREAYDLRYIPMSRGLKIDHPKKATIDDRIFDGQESGGIGSKDVWDSWASAVYSLKMSIDAGEEDGYGNGVQKQMAAITSLSKNPREEAGKAIQGMLESIF